MIFDKESSKIISLNFLQSEGFELEVFLFEDIENIKSEKMNYVSAIYFLTNPAKSLKFFQQELKDPNFKDILQFHEFFHGDSGKGLGASHQTGWTGLVCDLIFNLNGLP